MKKKRNHFAIVLDEYGGMNGIITMSDLLEEIVGDLDDDDSVPAEPPPIERIDSRTWKIQGTAPLKIVAERLEVALLMRIMTPFGGFCIWTIRVYSRRWQYPELEVMGMHIKVAGKGA